MQGLCQQLDSTNCQTSTQACPFDALASPQYTYIRTLCSCTLKVYLTPLSSMAAPGCRLLFDVPQWGQWKDDTITSLNIGIFVRRSLVVPYDRATDGTTVAYKTSTRTFLPHFIHKLSISVALRSSSSAVKSRNRGCLLLALSTWDSDILTRVLRDIQISGSVRLRVCYQAYHVKLK